VQARAALDAQYYDLAVDSPCGGAIERPFVTRQQSTPSSRIAKRGNEYSTAMVVIWPLEEVFSDFTLNFEVLPMADES
jgi:hypothetical protein